MLKASDELVILAEANQDNMVAASRPDGSKLLLSPHGIVQGTSLKDAAFVDPNNQKRVRVDHHTLQVVSSDELQGAQRSILDSANVGPLREAVDAAMVAHTQEWLPKGVVTTFASTNGSSNSIICCVSAIEKDFQNYWAGNYVESLPGPHT